MVFIVLKLTYVMVGVDNYKLLNFLIFFSSNKEGISKAIPFPLNTVITVLLVDSDIMYSPFHCFPYCFIVFFKKSFLCDPRNLEGGCFLIFKL